MQESLLEIPLGSCQRAAHLAQPCHVDLCPYRLHLGRRCRRWTWLCVESNVVNSVIVVLHAGPNLDLEIGEL